MRTTPAARAASVIVGLEAVGLLALTGAQVVAIVAGDTASLAGAVGLVVLTGIGAVAVGAFAVAIWRGLSWGRSGGVVTQVLVLAVAFGAVTGVYANLGAGLALAIPAVLALILLIVASRPAGRPDGSGGAAV